MQKGDVINKVREMRTAQKRRLALVVKIIKEADENSPSEYVTYTELRTSCLMHGVYDPRTIKRYTEIALMFGLISPDVNDMVHIKRDLLNKLYEELKPYM